MLSIGGSAEVQREKSKGQQHCRERTHRLKESYVPRERQQKQNKSQHSREFEELSKTITSELTAQPSSAALKPASGRLCLHDAGRGLDSNERTVNSREDR
jgi:hypothetical protein